MHGQEPERSAGNPCPSPRPLIGVAGSPGGAAIPERRALYLRYRSQRFGQLVGQDHVARTLRNAIAGGQVAHAYLLTGPRGTGKTTTARLVAKAVNCGQPSEGEPCDVCENCVAIREGRFLDLIEIDAASNRSIDDVRELREKVRFAPSQGRYKVYVVDEVHQLSGDAFNALLKTLEEPPDHVIFVLATTEAHKVPATIVSRTQRFDLRRIAHRDIVETLRRICVAEGFRCEDAALAAIARHASGSLRDAEGLLDQVATFAGGAVTLAEVAKLLGLADWEEVSALFDALAANDAAKGVALVGELLDGGRDLREFVRRALEHARSLVVVAATGKAPADVGEQPAAVLARQAKVLPLARLARISRRLTETEQQLRYGESGPLPLELAILELTEGARAPVRAGEPTRLVTPPRSSPGGASSTTGSAPPRTAAAARSQGEAGVGEPPAVPLAKIAEVWHQVIERFRARSIGLAAHLAQGEPVSIEGHVVTVGFANEFARAKASGDVVRAEVERMLAELVGSGLKVRCLLRTPEGDDPMMRAAFETLARPDRILEVE